MIKKVKRDTLADQVTDGLLAFIDAQDLAPGDSLPSEIQLAEEFGVSRPVIREALKTLQGEGLIEVVTGKSAMIKPVSSAMLQKFFERAIAFKSASFKDLIELRRGLEIQSVTLAAQRCTEADIEQLKNTLAQMRTQVKAHEQFADLDVAFHLHIASAACNPMIYHLIKSIRDVMHENVIRGLEHRFTDAAYEQVLVRHDAILQALMHHDADAAQLAMQAHFDEAMTALLHDKDG